MHKNTLTGPGPTSRVRIAAARTPAHAHVSLQPPPPSTRDATAATATGRHKYVTAARPTSIQRGEPDAHARFSADGSIKRDTFRACSKRARARACVHLTCARNQLRAGASQPRMQHHYVPAGPTACAYTRLVSRQLARAPVGVLIEALADQFALQWRSFRAFFGFPAHQSVDAHARDALSGCATRAATALQQRGFEDCGAFEHETAAAFRGLNVREVCVCVCGCTWARIYVVPSGWLIVLYVHVYVRVCIQAIRGCCSGFWDDRLECVNV